VFDPTDIKNRQQWYQCLQAARLRTEEVRAAGFAWTVMSVISGRLDGMEAAVADGGVPTLRDRERAIGLAVIAIKALDRPARDYSQLLKDLVDAFSNWAELPD
jgi:hypothetical protein